MNSKIEKLRLERTKKEERLSRYLGAAAGLQEALQVIDEKIRQMENEEIIAAIRSEGLSPEQVFALLQELKEKGPSVVVEGSEALLAGEAAEVMDEED